MEEANRMVRPNKIEALIVIYNKSLADSLTFESIKGVPGIHITVADNSTQYFGNEKAAYNAGCSYIDMHGNQGLSKAYNKAIATLPKTEELLCLFDDDTRVGETYFSALREAEKKYKDVDIFVPIVMDKKGMLSPCMIYRLECVRVKKVEAIPAKNLSAINSGMAIRLRVFENYAYDEGQFLDYVDHAFIRDAVRRGGAKMVVMEDAVINQTFSGAEKSSLEADKRRFSIYKKDVGYFCEKYGISRIKKDMHLLKRRLNIYKKHLF